MIKHHLQADNLHRLKAIDDKRFSAYQKKAGSAKQKTNESAEQIFEIIKNGFIGLKFETEFNCEAKSRPLIPVPGYEQTRINHLSNDQREEYFYAFSPHGTPELLIKYMPIRLNSYLMSLIFFYDKDELSKIKNEIDILHEVGAIHNFAMNDLQKIIRHFESLSDAERLKKLKYCQKVDDPAPGASRSMTIVISFDFLNQPEKHAIDISSTYLSFLERTNSNGERTEKNTSRWNQDLEAIRKIDDGPLCKAAREACWEGSNPEEVVQATTNYINALIDLGKRMDPLNAGQLQLGYWVDKLTVAHGKLKNWGEVVKWTEWFFALDNPYFERLSNGERDKIQKRLERAKKEIKKTA